MISTILSFGILGILGLIFVGIIFLTICFGLIKLFIAFASDIGGLILAVGVVGIILFSASCLRGML